MMFLKKKIERSEISKNIAYIISITLLLLFFFFNWDDNCMLSGDRDSSVIKEVLIMKIR